MTLGGGRAALVAAVLGLAAQPAHGAAYLIEARTEAQAYQLRAYRGDPGAAVLLPRRRLVQHLGLDVFELLPGRPLGFEASLRLFADLGLPRAEAARIDGLRAEEADLLYANVSYQGPRTELRVGRQLHVDLMDYLAFDGLRLRYVYGSGLGGEAYAGLWVKGSTLLGSSVYQSDGTRESDLRRLVLQVPGASPELDDLEPVFGAKLLWQDLAGFSGSLGYRLATLAGKTDLERVVVEARYGKGRGLNLQGGLEYDLFLPRISQARLLARLDRELLAISLEGLRSSPVLSADSIFLYFATAPRDEARLRVDLTPPGAFRYYGTLAASLHHANLNDGLAIAGALADPSLQPGVTYGGSAGAALRTGSFRGAADVTARAGFGGRQVWIDLTAGHAPPAAPYSLDARLSAVSLADPWNPRLRGNFLGAQLWGSYSLTPSARVSLLLEENVSALTRSDFKLFLLFDVRAWI